MSDDIIRPIFCGPAFLDYWQPKIKQLRTTHGLANADHEERLNKLDQLITSHPVFDIELFRLTAPLLVSMAVDGANDDDLIRYTEAVISETVLYKERVK